MNEKDWLLFDAIINMNIEGAKKSIEIGANVNFKCYDNNPALLWASCEENPESLRLLIQCGANVNAKNDYNQTPLYWAIYYGRLENIKILIQNQANINDVNYNKNIWYVAVTAKEFSYEIMEYLYTIDSNINIQNEEEETPLHFAVKNNKPKSVEFLINKNADITIKDENNSTAMDLAVEKQNIEIIYILLHKIDYHTLYQILQNYFFHVNNFNDMQFYKQIKNIYQKLIAQHKDLLHAPIAISYRNEEGKRMHGAFYDHYLMRKITKHSTHLIKADSVTRDSFDNFIQNKTVLRLGLDESMDSPQNSNKNEMQDIDGLIFIPGRPSEKGNDFDARCNFELTQIARAMLRGQPVLAICAGAWRLFEACVSKIITAQLNTSSLLVDSTDHTYRSMPYIVQNGGVGNNVIIHDVILHPNTMLESIYQHQQNLNLIEEESDASKPPYVEVNSVHWQVINQTIFNNKHVANMFAISATSTGKRDIKNSQQNNMIPDENIVEAFETKTGVPMLGIQWHPEAFFKNKKAEDSNNFHLNIIRNMTLAGDAYHAKRNLLKEFKNLIQKTDGDCKKILS